jgi:nucleoside-diphosphate-sugar epimerase
MRVFLAGATGVIGRRLVPLLVDGGHEVVGMTRSPDSAGELQALGAVPVVCDVYDLDGLRAAMARHEPDLILHQLTDLPDDPARIRDFVGANARVRREGTANLLAAWDACGAQRFVIQSVAWDLGGDGGAATREMERMVLDAGGVVLRYGQFYGPGTYHEKEPPPGPRIHIAAAAQRTIETMGQPSGVITIVDS